MNSPALDLSGVLVSAGVGVFNAASGWSIHVSAEPTSPHTTITLFDTGGFPPSPQVDLDEPTVQVRIRGEANGYLDAYAKTLAVRDALHTFRGIVDSLTRYAGVLAMTEPVHIGSDDSTRPLFTVNFRMFRSPIGGAYPR